MNNKANDKFEALNQDVQESATLLDEATLDAVNGGAYTSPFDNNAQEIMHKRNYKPLHLGGGSKHDAYEEQRSWGTK